MLRRHGKSPIEWLHDIGVLGPNTILGHVLYTDFHPHTKDKVQRDIKILVETGTTVAHCPRVFATTGEAMHSFGAYRDAGVKLAMGTDTYPLNIIEEMQLALMISRLVSETFDYPKSQHVFEAATTGVAKALNRTDICRLAVGAQADVVLVDLTHHSMRPARDPLKNLLHTASSEAVRDVYVAGQLVVSDRKVLTIDFDDALKRLGEGQQRAMKRVPELHHAGMTAEEISPLSLPVDESTRT
jgi:cytosine/adenosine deaminase-related metal-dependent hydrolase